MTPGETAALQAFERLGLTSYEAKVFVALHRLGSGSAREVASVADVPRSQVYTVAEELEGRGLVEIQQSNPIRYRPVSVDEARETLRDRFEGRQARAFEYVETVREESDGSEEQEDVWTVRGSDRVTARAADLLSNAIDRVLYAVRLPELVTGEIERALGERVAEDVDVTVVTASDDVRDRFDPPPTSRSPRHRSRDRTTIGPGGSSSSTTPSCWAGSTTTGAKPPSGAPSRSSPRCSSS